MLPVAPLDGAGGYLRWKESMLLRLRTLGIAYVLKSEVRPCPPGQAPSNFPAAREWERDDELCRGHILATLSDRILPDYARHATAAAVWRAVACTYDLDTSDVLLHTFSDYKFVKDKPVLEELAHLEALGAAGKLKDHEVADRVKAKLPPNLARETIGAVCMDDIWKAARTNEVGNMVEECMQRRNDLQTAEGDANDDDRRSPKWRRLRGPCYNCGNSGHIARNCNVRIG